jgi:uncharacterized membrane protein YphA (DoxX/SURF4 family)
LQSLVAIRRDAWAWLYLGLRLGLGLVFAYAGAAKLLDIKAFGVIIARYGLVPEPLLLPAALGLPALEVLAGLGLALDLRGSLGAVTAMLAMFCGVLWFGILRGLEIDCGCFSAGELAQQDSLRQALHRDLAMLAAAAYLYSWRWFRGARWAGPGRGRQVNPRHPKEEMI